MTIFQFYNSLLLAIAIGFLVMLILCGFMLTILVRRGALNARITANTAIMPAVRAERQVRIAEKNGLSRRSYGIWIRLCKRSPHQ